jgi:indole-3-glycerol phosphate synthase
MNVLDAIMAERRRDVAAARRAVPPGELEAAARGRAHHGLRARLAAATAPAVIAEMKKASPSAGLLRAAYDPAALARAYREAGAAALSVLTEPRHFLGDAAHLRAARAAAGDLPVLRKDFMVDTYQVLEAAAWGADAVLLIAAALDDAALAELHAAARDYGLDVLVESHDAAELERALVLDDAIIGVNSRNLKTLRTDLATARDLASRIPADRAAVAESGIRTREDVRDLYARGYRGFLVGESLLRHADPGAALSVLAGGGGRRDGER